MKHLLSAMFLLAMGPILWAQEPVKPSSSEIFESIKKLNFLGSVLYVAAHPDDENTQMISYFSNEKKARTAYLSITRGDGGQNLIGPQLRAQLGLIRTQELLAARRMDGGEQFFTRANDFGYSKHPDETLDIWKKDEVLKDVVSIMRKFKPDVIINRFDHRTPGSTHGHHTSSAILSVMAFDLVSDANFESHGLYTPWKPKRQFFNTSPWFYGGAEKFAKVDKSNMLSFDTGVYFESRGVSNPEIAALSRSQHQSQGFGSTGSRGSRIEYIEFLNGELPKDKCNIFEGIDTSWNRVQGGKAIGTILKEVERDFDFRKPANSVSKLVKALVLIDKLENKHWRELKSKAIKEIIAACSGLYLEAASMQESTSEDEAVTIRIEAINRSAIPMKLLHIGSSSKNENIDTVFTLANNLKLSKQLRVSIPEKAELSTPYWLLTKGEVGMYNVPNKALIGNPESILNHGVNFLVEINNTPIDFYRPIIYKYNDPVKGEVYKPFQIIPAYTAAVADDVTIFGDNTTKEIEVSVRTTKDNGKGIVKLSVPEGWRAFPEQISFVGLKKDLPHTYTFKLTPPKGQSEGYIKPVIVSEGQTFDKKRLTLDYDHIPFQTIIVPSESKVVRLNIQKKGERVAYIHGAGDQVPTSLRQIGYTVIELQEKEITKENLQNFDAVILGIRAYNVNDGAKNYQQTLHNYTENGGTLIVQYNTNRRLKVEEVAPLMLKLSRDRVVEENTKVTLLAKQHEMLNAPNKIDAIDFEGWVQERGLYFPNKWSDDFTPILGMNDQGETEKTGSLLVAKFGKGHFIYTGLSFFRELPAGVPGAYKLFANMLSIGKNDKKPLKN